MEEYPSFDASRSSQATSSSSLNPTTLLPGICRVGAKFLYLAVLSTRNVDPLEGYVDAKAQRHCRICQSSNGHQWRANHLEAMKAFRFKFSLIGPAFSPFKGTMSELETFFRRCPKCGRRFEIRLVGKKLIDSQTLRKPMPVNRDFFEGFAGSFLEVGESEPAIISFEDFQYSYKCKHCGHLWVDIKEKDFREE
jgi:hypothetical protein